MNTFPQNPRNPRDSRQSDYVNLVPVYGDHSFSSRPFVPGLEGQQTVSSSIDLTALGKTHWLLILILILLGVAGGVASIVLQSPVYKSRVLLEIQGINEVWLKNSFDVSSTYDTNEVNIQTQIQLLRSGPFLGRVFERLQTESVPLAPVGTDVFSRLRQRARPGTQDPMQNVRDGLAEALSTFDARPVTRTRLIELTCDSTSPDIASQFLNTIATEFIEDTIRSRMQTSQKTSEWLGAQIEETKLKLQEAEERLQEFIRSSGNLFVSADTLDDAKLAQLRGELSRIQAERIAKQTKYELVTKNPRETLPELLDDAGLRGYLYKINELLREKAVLETTYTAENLKVKKLDAQLSVLRDSLQKELTGITSRIRNEYEAALRQERSLATAYSSLSQQVTAIAGKAAKNNALKREVEILRQMYQSLLIQSNQAGLTSSVPVNPVRLVEPSTPAREPYRPVPPLNISFGAIAGIGLAVGIIFLREKLDRSVKSPGLSLALMNAPELGVIPTAPNGRNTKGLLARFRKKEREAYTLIPIGQRDGNVTPAFPSSLAESFRVTLASLLHQTSNNQSQVILVTSSGPGEGKTTITANLGMALAETGRRVILVDADFRRPRLHETFNISNERSLLDMLSEETPIPEYMAEGLGVKTAVDGLIVLPNRAAGQKVSRALYSPRLPAIIERMRELFDVVVIDAPPILELADARIVGRLTDGAILVVRAGVTDRARAMEAYHRICADGLRVFGTVLNDWSPSKSHMKSHYYYSYSESDDQT